jgi:hypothetical protein
VAHLLAEREEHRADWSLEGLLPHLQRACSIRRSFLVAHRAVRAALGVADQLERQRHSPASYHQVLYLAERKGVPVDLQVAGPPELVLAALAAVLRREDHPLLLRQDSPILKALAAAQSAQAAASQRPLHPHQAQHQGQRL